MADIFKDNPVVAILPLIESVFTQLKVIRKRSAWVSEKRFQFGPLGAEHWIIDVLPIGLSMMVSFVAVVSSLAFLATNGMGWIPTQEPWKQALTWNADHYDVILFVWFVHAVVVHFNGITRFLWVLVGLSPRARRQIGFTNASWHIKRGDESPAIALARESPRKIAGDIVSSLVKSAPNPNLALRPAGLNNDEAANLLYFGHVIECAMTQNKIRWSTEIWTAFYQALGSVATTKARPLAPAAVASFTGKSYFREVVLLLNDHRPAGLAQMPDDYDIPTRVDAAHRVLAHSFQGDARRLGHRLMGYSYYTALKRCRKIKELELEEICRQFAKLAILWQIWPKARHPAMFEIPFSRSIAMYLLELSWLRTDADRLTTDDTYFLNAFDVAESTLVNLAADIVDEATDATTVTWHAAQQKSASSAGLDAAWYLRYRIDQHIYHLARTASIKHWRADDTAIIRTTESAP